MTINQTPVLSTLAVIELGRGDNARLVAIGDERTIEQHQNSKRGIRVNTGNGVATVHVAGRWTSTTGAVRFKGTVRGDKGTGPRGGRVRYGQTVAALYISDDVEPMDMPDAYALLAAEAEALADGVGTVDTSTRTRRTSKRQDTSTSDQGNPLMAALAALPPDALAALLAQVTGNGASEQDTSDDDTSEQDATPAPASTRTRRTSTSTSKRGKVQSPGAAYAKRTSKRGDQTAALLGVD